jgi:hypothetical protein
MSRYTIDGIQYPSVTEILGLLEKGAGFYYWIGDQALKTNKPDGYKIKQNETCDIGHELHTIIEKYINLILNKNSEKYFNIEIFFKNIKDKKLRQMFYQFYNWQVKNVRQFISSEGQIVHEKFCYAGTYDFIWEDSDGYTHLTDIKTKNELYGIEKIQLSAYKYAYENMKKDQYIISNKKGFENWEVIQEHKELKIDYIDVLKISRDFFEAIELKDFSKDSIKYFEAFKGLLQYYYFSAKRKLNNLRIKNEN